MKNSFPFSSIIRQFFPCVDSQFMASFDIDSLLNNAPLDKIIKTPYTDLETKIKQIVTKK